MFCSLKTTPKDHCLNSFNSLTPLTPFLEDSRQIVVVIAFCHEFAMQAAGFGDGFQ